MRVGYVVIAPWSIGCVVNGRAFGPSVASAGPSGGGSTGASPPMPVSAPDTHAGPAEPADPWAAVDGDQPVRWSEDAANYERPGR